MKEKPRGRPVLLYGLHLAALGAIAVVYGARPHLLAEGYLTRVYPTVAGAFGWLSALSPVPAWELASALIAAAALGFTALRVVRVRRKEEKPAAALGKLARGALALASAGVVLFLLGGGFVLARAPAEARLGLAVEALRAEDYAEAARRAALAAAAAREAMPEEIPGLATTSAKSWLAFGRTADFPYDPAAIEAAAREAMARAVRLLDRRDFARFPSARRPVPDTLLHTFGATGAAPPPFAEVTTSPYCSAIYHTYVLLHELAHAAGILREREADFYAFVAANESTEPLIRYAGNLHAMVTLAGVAMRGGVPDALERALEELPKAAREEVRTLRKLSQLDAFAPGGSVAVGAGGALDVKSGAQPWSAGVAASQAVRASIGVPPDYAASSALIAAWIARTKLD